MDAESTRILELLPGLVCSFDTNLRYVYSNEAYARMRGHDPHAILGLHYSEIVGPTNAVAIRKPLEEALLGISADFEYDIITATGKRRALANYRPNIGLDGKVYGVHAFITDLTTVRHRHLLDIEKEALFEDSFRNAPIGIAIVDPLAKITRANESFASMLGRTPADMVGVWLGDISHPDDLDSDRKAFLAVLNGRSNGYRLDKRYIHADGSVVEAALSVSAMRNAAGEIVYFVSHALDLTEQRKAARALEASNMQLSLAMEIVRGGFWQYNISSSEFQTSRQLGQFIHGPEGTELDIGGYLDRIPSQDRDLADMSALIDGDVEQAVAQYRLATLAGERWMRCERRLIRDGAGRPMTIVGVVIDITEEYEQLQRSREQADTDSLTGLLNRRGLQHRVERAVGQRHWAALVVDLDGFKQVNDIHGHAAGDHVLIETARRMLGVVRDGDIVARLGGDEFVVVLPNGDRAMLNVVANRLIEAVRQPSHFSGHTLQVSCSIGAASLEAGQTDLAAALKQADAALYQAKASGKNTWRV
nr:diguanylate cyclase [Rhizobium sp. RU36D]